MREEVRIESLETLEFSGGEVRILANSGDLALVFPRALWEKASSETARRPEPGIEELAELEKLRRALKRYALAHQFAAVLTDVPCGDEDSGRMFDLVLRPSGLFAATTGYVFLPVVRAEHMARLRVHFEEDGFVEQAYLVGAVVEEKALAAGDEGLKALSVRGRRCSCSRFELAPELWRVLSEELGWKNVQTVTIATQQRNL